LVTPLLEPFDLGPESMIVDVGSGDGRVLIRATQVFGCRGRGIELDGELVELSRAHVTKAGLADRITIEESDLRDSSVDDADLVFAFLPGSAASSVIPEIQPRLALGASLVAHEQERIDWVVPPDSSRLVVSDSGITVAHVWAG
jgi:tRNA A58 N-methylase Trm61